MDALTHERFNNAQVDATRAAAVASACKAVMFICIGAAFLAGALVLVRLI